MQNWHKGELNMSHAIIEADSDGKGFSCVCWHMSNDDAHKHATRIKDYSEACGESRALYIVDKEQFKHLNQLEAAGMLQF